jgi:hypothetical protein
MSGGKITISYKCDEFEIIDVEFKSNEDVVIFMSWCDLTKQQYALEQSIIKKFISGQSIKEDNVILGELNERRKAYEEEQRKIENEVDEVEDELEEEKWEKARLLQIEKDKEDTKKMEEENKKRCDDFKKRYEEEHGVDCDTLEPIKITYEDINNKIENGISFLTHKPFTASTKKSYKNSVKNIHKHFKLDDYTQLLKGHQPLIDYIYETYDKDSTKKSHLSCLLFLVKSYAPNEDNEVKITNLTKVLLNNLTTKRSNEMDEGKEDIKKAYSLLAFMKEQKK